MEPFFVEDMDTELEAGFGKTSFPSPAARPTRQRFSLPAPSHLYLNQQFSPERLPRHSPYVGQRPPPSHPHTSCLKQVWVAAEVACESSAGTFHHGFKASNADVPTFDVDLEKLSPKNPHVGTFKHSARTKVRTSSLEEVTSQSASQRSTFGEEHIRRQSFKDIGDWLKSPELCGLQAVVPKGCGIRIMDKVLLRTLRSDSLLYHMVSRQRTMPTTQSPPLHSTRLQSDCDLFPRQREFLGRSAGRRARVCLRCARLRHNTEDFVVTLDSALQHRQFCDFMCIP